MKICVDSFDNFIRNKAKDDRIIGASGMNSKADLAREGGLKFAKTNRNTANILDIVDINAPYDPIAIQEGEMGVVYYGAQKRFNQV
jgi:hypothetical protein